MPQQRLAEGVENGLLEKTGPAEAGGKRAIQFPSDPLAAGGPVEISPCPFGQRLGRKKPPFHRHGHAVASQGWDHGEGVPDPDAGLFRCPSGPQGDGGDAGEGIFIPADTLKPAMESRAGFAAQPVPPVSGKIRNGFTGAKEAADIHAVILHGAQTHVAVRGEMHLQIPAHRNIKGMSLEADPAPSLFPDGGLATRGGDPTLAGGRRLPGLYIKASSRCGEKIREELVKAVARQAEGGTG